MIALIGLRWHIGGGTSGYNFMCDSYCLDRWQKHLGKAETNCICPATTESWTIRLMYFLVIMCSQAAECWRKVNSKRNTWLLCSFWIQRECEKFLTKKGKHQSGWFPVSVKEPDLFLNTEVTLNISEQKICIHVSHKWRRWETRKCLAKRFFQVRSVERQRCVETRGAMPHRGTHVLFSKVGWHKT